MTLPFLGLTPAFVLVIDVLLTREVYSWSGAIGVLLVTAGGYRLVKTMLGPRPVPPTPMLSVDGAASTPGSGLDDKLAANCATTSNDGPRTVPEHTPPWRKWLTWAPRWVTNLLVVAEGSLLMLTVAILWAVSSVFDKIGTREGGIAVHGLAVQACVAVPAALQTAWSQWRRRRRLSSYRKLSDADAGKAPPLPPVSSATTKEVTSSAPGAPSASTVPLTLLKLEDGVLWQLLIVGGGAMIFSYILQLAATQEMPTSYVISIKRAGALIAILVSCCSRTHRQGHS